MRVLVVSAFLPTRDFIAGPSSVPYSYLRNRPSECEFHLLHYAYHPSALSRRNELSDLDLTSVREVPMKPLWRLGMAQGLQYLRGLPWGCGLFMPSPADIKWANDLQPDVVWIYPMWLHRWHEVLEAPRVIVTGPDSGSLLYERRSMAVKTWLAKRLEKLWGRSRASLHFVGQSDLEQYRRVAGEKAHAFYSPMSHFDFEPVMNPSLADIVNVLITGGKTFYSGDHLTRLVSAFAKRDRATKDKVSWTFVGKGYRRLPKLLQEAGYSVSVKEWVDSYEDEVALSQVQIFPIAVGTGAKRKVVTALASGLLCIGSTWAFENLEISSENVITYDDPEDVPSLLENALTHPAESERMARAAAEEARRNHSPERTGRLFWERAL